MPNSALPAIDTTPVEFQLAPGAGLADLALIVQAGLAVPGVVAQIDFEAAGVTIAGGLPGLAKALKVGGPAHAGHSLEAIPALQLQARANVQRRVNEGVSQLAISKDGFVAACALYRAAAANGNATQMRGYLATIRKSVERQGRLEIRATVESLWQAGRHIAGHFGPLSKDERIARTKFHRLLQQRYAHLLDNIENDDCKMPLDRRIEMYGPAMLAAVNYGYLFADLSQNRYLKWRKSPIESCTTCSTLANGGKWGNGTYRAAELAKAGFVPRCDKLLCWGGCKCSLREVEQPVSDGKGVLLKDMDVPANVSGDFRGDNAEKYERNTKRNRWNWQKRDR